MCISSTRKLQNLVLWRNIETTKQLTRNKVRVVPHRVHTTQKYYELRSIIGLLKSRTILVVHRALTFHVKITAIEFTELC
jgi:hypothetical protein